MVASIVAAGGTERRNRMRGMKVRGGGGGEGENAKEE